MKLTDIMFNLNFLAKNVGAEMAQNGDIFEYESLVAADNKITLKYVPQTFVDGSTINAWYRKSSADPSESTGVTVTSTKEITGLTDDETYCVTYRRKDTAAEVITVDSQFIPAVVHAVLTVSLYAGDSCNVEGSSRVGFVEIDIPRLQLNGAAEISMTASGAAQTPLEGNALAAGCTGCDGKAYYATITKHIDSANWYDSVQGIVIEDLADIQNGATSLDRDVVVYAYYANKVPKKLDNSLLTFSGEDVINGKTTNIACTSNGHLSLANASAPIAPGTFLITVNVTAQSTLETNKSIIVSA